MGISIQRGREMGCELLLIFQEVENAGRGGARRHDLLEMGAALLSMLTGGGVDTEDYGGTASRGCGRASWTPGGAFGRPCFSWKYWGGWRGGPVAVDGKGLRWSSRTHPNGRRPCRSWL